MNEIWRESRLALRQIRNAPGFSVVAILSIALGIAGTAVVVDVLGVLLLRSPGGVEAPEEVRRLYIVRDEGVVRTPDGGPGSYLDVEALRAGLRGVAGVAAFLAPQEYDDGRGASARRVQGQPVSGEYFSLLGVRPAVGRLLGSSDESAGNVVVLSHGFWERRFAGDRDVIGRTMMLDGRLFTVIGVAAREFGGVEGEPVDLWLPLSATASALLYRPEVALFEVLLRLDSEAGEAEVVVGARERLAAIAAEHSSLDPSPGVLLGPLNVARGPHPPGVLRLTLVLGVATAVLLLIACANFANLLLARAAGRRRELAVRRALGAGERRIVRQLVSESVVLALFGGMVGLVLAVLVSLWVGRLPEIPPRSGVDLLMAGFAFVASLATGLVLGLAAGVSRGRRRGPIAFDRGGERVTGRLPSALVAFQVALAVVLLVGAGIFLRSLQKVVTIDTGLDLENLAVVSMDWAAAGFDRAQVAEIHERALERLEALPGVEASSFAIPLPLTGRGWGMTVERRGHEGPRLPEGPYAYLVGPSFFRTAGIRILAGRPFTDRDGTGSEPAAIVSSVLADALAPNGDAVGMCVAVGPEQSLSGACTRIVGVAENVRHRYLLDQPIAYVYLPQSQVPFEKAPSMFQPDLLVRTNGDVRRHLGAIRASMQAVYPNLPYVEVQSYESFVGERAIRPFRITALLLGVFGALALLLAMIGLYGTVSHLVVARVREIGLRMALGASRAVVLRLVLRQALVPVAIGLALGLLASGAMARLIDVQMLGLTVRDPVTVGLVSIALAASGIVGAWLPARRAASVDPLLALRTD